MGALSLKVSRIAAALLAVALGSGAQVARADAQTIVRVRSGNPTLDERLGAELDTLGFSVVDVDASRDDLGAIAASKGAVAAVRIDDDEGVELWVDKPGEAPIRTHVHAEAKRGFRVTIVLALEALRAHLILVHATPKAAPPPRVPAPLPAPTIAPTAAPPPRAPWLWLHLGAGADASPGGLGPAFDLLGEVRANPRRWLALSLFATASPTLSHLREAEGTASIRRFYAGAAADLEGHVGRTTLALGAGATFVFLRVEGAATSAGFAAHDASIVVVAPIVRTSASWALRPRSNLRAALLAGVATPHANVLFAGRKVADFGAPLVLFTLGLDWGAL